MGFNVNNYVELRCFWGVSASDNVIETESESVTTHHKTPALYSLLYYQSEKIDSEYPRVGGRP